MATPPVVAVPRAPIEHAGSPLKAVWLPCGAPLVAVLPKRQTNWMRLSGDDLGSPSPYANDVPRSRRGRTAFRAAVRRAYQTCEFV